MDTATMNRHFIALQLGKTIEEIEGMAVSEFLSWKKYFEEVRPSVS